MCALSRFNILFYTLSILFFTLSTLSHSFLLFFDKTVHRASLLCNVSYENWQLLKFAGNNGCIRPAIIVKSLLCNFPNNRMKRNKIEAYTEEPKILGTIYFNGI